MRKKIHQNFSDSFSLVGKLNFGPIKFNFKCLVPPISTMHKENFTYSVKAPHGKEICHHGAETRS